MKNLVVKEQQKFMGVRIPVIEGGFGENKRVISVQSLSTIHKRDEKHLNELINNNLSRFKEGIDYINLLNHDNFKVVVNDLGLKTSNSQKYAYILSERGYSKLIKLLDDDIAWEVMDKLIDEYFTLRAEQKRLTQEEIIILQMKDQLKIKKQLNEVNHHALQAKSKIIKLEKDFIEYKENDTLSVAECEELSDLVKKIGVARLGGKDTKAYKYKSVRISLFRNIWGKVRNEFNVRKYKQIKRKHFLKAREIILDYEPPTFLKEEIRNCNNQYSFMEELTNEKEKSKKIHNSSNGVDQWRV